MTMLGVSAMGGKKKLRTPPPSVVVLASCKRSILERKERACRRQEISRGLDVEGDTP